MGLYSKDFIITKSKIVADDYIQVENVDSKEAFSPVVNIISIR